MKKILIITCALLILLMTSGICHADRHGHGRGNGHGSGHGHGHGGWGVVVIPAPIPIFPQYAPAPDCENHCYERVVPTCRRDAWGDRWCRDEVIRDCRRVCY